MDDALSIKELSNGNFLVKIYIADVTTSSHLDIKKVLETSINSTQTLIKRGRMNKAPSRRALSLAAGKERKVNVFELQLDKNNGEIVDFKVDNRVIIVDANYSPESIQNIKNDGGIRECLYLLKRIYPVIYQKRLVESKYIYFYYRICNEFETFKPYNLQKTLQYLLNLCAEQIAEYFLLNNYPFLYYNRIFESPNLLNQFIDKHNEESGKLITIDTLEQFNKLKSQIQYFSTKNAGYSFLGAKCYCKFSSPISMKGSTITNVLIEELIHNEATPSKIQYWSNQLNQFEKRKIFTRN